MLVGRSAAMATPLAILALVGCESAPMAPTPPPASPLIALTPTEYNNTIRDLLGLPRDGNARPKAPAVAEKLGALPPVDKGVFTPPPAQAPFPYPFPPEIGVDDFEGMAEGQEPSPYAIEELQKAALRFGCYALVSPTFFACANWESLPAEEQTACSWTSIERFAQRAWRRPMRNDERTRLRAFWQNNADSGAADEAIALTVAGILQSPSFVYRVERGDPNGVQGDAIALSDWEMASRLSYFLWDTMPDPELLAAANKGELSTPEQIRAQARRMLDDPKARYAVVRFHEQWLGTTKIHGISPARRVYGPVYGLDPEPPLDTTGDGDWPAILLPIRHSMEAETHLFVERTVFDGAGTLSALLTDNHGYMSDQTRPLYGEGAKILPLPTETWTFGRVALSIGGTENLTLYAAEFPRNERAGVLTLPSVLALGAHPVHPAPILRGKRILERIACQTFPAPPAGVEAAAPPDSESATSTNRERTETATSSANCAVCHDALNPPGFAFENYDAIGAWRTNDNGQTIDASGNVHLSSGETIAFDDGVDLAEQLAKSDQVRNCYVLRWAQYAMGIELPAEHAAVEKLAENFRGNDRVRNLLTEIAGSDLFRYRRAGGAP